jgi:uncharacterized protein YbaR (Trm112 family)
MPFDGLSPKKHRNRWGDIMAIDKELLEILACPKCKGDIVVVEKGDGLICKSCKLLYPIRDDIPVMLIDEALPYEGE